MFKTKFLSVLLAGMMLAAVPAFAQNATPTPPATGAQPEGIHQMDRDIRNDRRDIHQDDHALREDHRELRDDRRDGDHKDAMKERGEIRGEQADRREDREKMGQERKERHAEMEKRHEEREEHMKEMREKREERRKEWEEKREARHEQREEHRGGERGERFGEHRPQGPNGGVHPVSNPGTNSGSTTPPTNSAQ